MRSTIKDKQRGDAAAIVNDRAGIPTAGRAQRDLDNTRRPGKTPVVAPVAIRGTQKTGDAQRDTLAALTKLKLVNDQSNVGSDPQGQATTPAVAATGEHTIGNGFVQRWRNGMWIPETTKDSVQDCGKADAATTPSSTASVTYQPAFSKNIALPYGKWTIIAVGKLRAIRASTSIVNLLLTIDGTDDPSPTSDLVDTTIYTEISTSQRLTDVLGGRTITVTLKYKGSTGSVTTAVKSPRIEIYATRES